MDFNVGKGEVEPLEQAEMAEVKIVAVDGCADGDVPFAVGVFGCSIMVAMFVEMGAAFAWIKADKFIGLDDVVIGIELYEDLSGHEADAFRGLHAAGGIKSILRRDDNSAVLEIISAGKVVGLEFGGEGGGAGWDWQYAKEQSENEEAATHKLIW